MNYTKFCGSTEKKLYNDTITRDNLKNCLYQKISYHSAKVKTVAGLQFME